MKYSINLNVGVDADSDTRSDYARIDGNSFDLKAGHNELYGLVKHNAIQPSYTKDVYTIQSGERATVDDSGNIVRIRGIDAQTVAVSINATQVGTVNRVGATVQKITAVEDIYVNGSTTYTLRQVENKTLIQISSGTSIPRQFSSIGYDRVLFGNSNRVETTYPQYILGIIEDLVEVIDVTTGNVVTQVLGYYDGLTIVYYDDYALPYCYLTKQQVTSFFVYDEGQTQWNNTEVSNIVEIIAWTAQNMTIDGDTGSPEAIGGFYAYANSVGDRNSNSGISGVLVTPSTGTVQTYRGAYAGLSPFIGFNFVGGATPLAKTLNGQVFEFTLENSIGGGGSNASWLSVVRINGATQYKPSVNINTRGVARTGTSGRNYFSVIGEGYAFGTSYFLRAVYGFAASTATTLSISFNREFFGRCLEVDNVDFSYIPRCRGNAIWYRSLEGAYVHINLIDFTTLENPIESIGRDLFKINTLDVINIIDTKDMALYPSGIDFNGAMIPASYGEDANYPMSIDTNYRQVIIANKYFQTPYAIFPHGASVLGTPIWASYFMDVSSNVRNLAYTTRKDISRAGDAVKTYDYSRYSTSDMVKLNPDYTCSPEYFIDGHYDQIPIYATFENGYVFLDGEVYPQSNRIGNIDFTSLIGNKQFETARFFQLLGLGDFLFDGEYIHIVDKGNQITTQVCHAYGLDYVCTTTTSALFLAKSDLGLWQFDGGRSLVRISSLARIFPSDGVAPTGETIEGDSITVIEKGGRIALICEGKITNLSNLNNDNYCSPYFIRAGGLYFVTPTVIQHWSSTRRDGYVPLWTIWRSANFSLNYTTNNISQIIVFLKSPTRENGIFEVKWKACSENYNLQDGGGAIAIGAADWDADNCYSFRIDVQDELRKNYCFSLRTYTPNDIILEKALVEVKPEAGDLFIMEQRRV